jgi:hypothetical protein
LNAKIIELKQKCLDVERASKQSLFRRVGSAAWVASFFTDYKREAQEAQSRWNLLVEELSKSMRELTQAQQVHGDLVSSRPRVIQEAADAERERQLGICRERAEALPGILCQSEEELAAAKTRLCSLEDGLDRSRKDLEQVTKDAAETARRDLVEELKGGLGELSTELAGIAEECAVAESRALEAAENLERLRTDLARQKDEEMQGMVASLDELREALSPAEEALLESARELGIKGPMETIREEITARRSALESELRQEREGLESSDDNEIDGPYGVAIPPLSAGGERGSSTEEAPHASGNLYLDFAKNEEDNQDARGRTFLGLRTQLERLRRKHGKTFFQDAPPGADLLSLFIETFFPEGLSPSYFICNLSLLTDQPYLQLRPQLISPRLERQLPRGISLAVSGRLWGHLRDPDNPVFQVNKIVDLTHSRRLPFERAISGAAFTHSVIVSHPSNRIDNLLSNNFVTQLPLISLETKERLQSWHDYLDWKERLVRARLVGLRYIDVQALPDGRIRFLTACESKENFDSVRSTLSSNDLQAYDLNYSRDPWEFQHNDDSRGYGTQLGDFAGQGETASTGKVDLNGMPWDEPYFAHIHFRLPEHAQNEFDDIISGGGTPEEAARPYLNSLNTSGFLALSVLGERVLINRQRTELRQLEVQSGNAPFLSSYLFDIKAANEPSELKTIEDDHWQQPGLNEDQKLAVRKMISTPDLAMVQGPPGTGKTTMIAEASLQFVREGKKVLLVSQASLAVNNVLERLKPSPAIRAVRLSHKQRKGELTHPYDQANAVGTYYRSIAQECGSRTLEVWSGAEERLSSVSKWLQSAKMVAEDVESLREKAEALKGKRAALRGELNSLKESEEHAAEIERQRRAANELQRFLEGADSFSETIPELLLPMVYDRIILPLDRLTEADIRANSLWSEREYGSPYERSRFAVEALLNWRKIAAFRLQLSGDAERLKSTEGDSVLSPEAAIRFSQLQRQLNETLKAMEEDETKVSEWQTIRKEIKAIKQQGAGLDKDTYALLFNVPENRSLSILTNSASKRSEVIDTLEGAHSLITEVEAEIDEGCKELCTELARHLDSLPRVEIDRDNLKRLEGELRHLSQQQAELSSDLAAKEKRLGERLSERSQSPTGEEPDLAKLDALLAAAQEEQASLTNSLKQASPLRDSWGDILQRWVSDLTNPETVRSDQDNFFSTYVNACNVIGVTCTERRHTLEDAGHTWFDAVIVDEVSKATPTEIIMPMMMARTAILVGDHRQLPPLFKEQEGSWEEAIAEREEPVEGDRDSSSELTEENFERFKKMVTSSLFKEHFENAPESLKSFLFTQYRMHLRIPLMVNTGTGHGER